ncbi:MAG: DUF4157 domain-containing protein [Oscillospiraceae bacterium]|jgi:hypothetical protein|nr:DUF4157 domain-containing protein [Oscillospiraceae bacterium]
MSESARIQEQTKTAPIRKRADDFASGHRKSRGSNPYEGKPLNVSSRLAGRIKESFGIDAGRLSLRESPEVAKMGARATAQGNAIRFAPGEFKPDTKDGLAVLGHELGHVADQARGAARGPGGKLLDSPAQEARSNAAGVAFAGGSLGASAAVSPASAQSAPVQRLTDEERANLLDQIQNATGVQPLRSMTEYMQSKIDSGNMGEVNEIMNMAYTNRVIPKMTAATQGWENMTESETARSAMQSVYRENNPYTALNRPVLNNAYKNERNQIRTILQGYEKRKMGRGLNIIDNTAEIDQMLIPILQSISTSIGGNDTARTGFKAADDALAQVPFFAQNPAVRKRVNFNNVVLRGINPALMDRVNDRVKPDRTGSRVPVGKDLEAQKVDVLLGRRLQDSLNDYTNHDNQGTAEAPNALHDIFDTILGQLSRSRPEAEAEPEASGSAWEGGEAYQTDLWKAESAAPAQAAPARKPWHKRLWGKIKKRLLGA